MEAEEGEKEDTVYIARNFQGTEFSSFFAVGVEPRKLSSVKC